MNKVKNFFLNKGIYLIAIVGVAAICLSGLYIANLSKDPKENPDNSNSAVSSTSDSQDVVALPTRKTEAPSGTGSTPSATPGGSTAPTATPSVAPTVTPSNNGADIKLVLPLEGNILVDYAMDKLIYNKTLDEWRTHSGVDIAADQDEEVKAAADGKVIDVKKDPRLGYLIIIEHKGGVNTIYANLKEETDVNIGDSVKQGDVIGWVGRTAPFEYAEDSHLHFEVVINDNCVNVWNYVDKE